LAQYDINLREYWRVVRKRKGIVILTTLLLTIFSIVMAFVRAPTPRYEATCSVKFEKAVSPLGIYTKVISWGPGSEIETQIAVIKGHSVFEKVAEALGQIDRTNNSNLSVDRKIADLQSKVKVTQEGNSNIVNIVATAPRPSFAAELANQVASAYKETRAQEVNQRIAEAIKFIKGQLGIVAERLRQSEDRLKQFREDKDIVALPAQSSSLLTRLSRLEIKLTDAVEAQMELKDVLRRVQEASRQPLSPERSYSADKASALYERLNARLVDLMLKRDSLLIQYTSSHPLVVEADKQISEITQKMVTELESQLRILAEREKALRQEVNLLKAEIQALPTKGLELARLEGDVERISKVYSLLESKYQEALIQDAERPEEVTVIRPAIEPSRPINPPNTFSSGILGLMIGLVLGLVFAFIVETFDTSLGAIDDVEQTLGLPVVGLIPYVESKEDKPTLIPHFSSQSVLAESFRSLRTNIQFSALEKDTKTIVVTSATPLEGKTVVAGNLAIAMAQGGLKTCLLSTDLRKPTLHKVFGLDVSPGLTDFLLGNGDSSRAIKTATDLMMGTMGVDEIMLTPGIDNLHIVTCGKIPSNPVELLESDKFKDFLDALYDSYDVILMDTPPLISAADASILATRVDAVLLVYRAGQVSRGILKRVKAQLEQVKANIIGVALNGVKAELSPDLEELKHYKYYYYYGEEGKKKKADKRKSEKKKGSRKSLRTLLLATVLCPLIVGLMLQTGLLDAEKLFFRYKPLIEHSNLASLPVKPLWPKKVDSASQTDSARNTEPPGTQLSMADITGFINIDRLQKAAFEPNSPPPADISSGIQATKSEKTDAPEIGTLLSGKKRNKKTPQIQFAATQDGSETKEEPFEAFSRHPTHFPYSLMTGSFRTLQLVNKEISFLKKQGLIPWWTRVDLGRAGIWFRVCVGHFQTAEAARDFKQTYNLKASKVIKTAYTNKIGKFTSKEEIYSQFELLRKAGYSPYIIEDPQEGPRLLIGSYVTEERAMQTARVLKDAGIISKVVLR
jgi:succinoglycan biosynthesis transport protein ExoP